MEIITIDNEHYIEGRIVMLPTRDITNIGKYIDSDNLVFNDHKSDIDRGAYQYLYVVCNIKPQDGDFVIPNDRSNPLCNTIFEFKQAPCPLPYWGNKDACKKVIAATDKLMLNDLSHIPQPTEQFIKEFVERQGKDVDVLVEMSINAKPNIDWEWKDCIKLNPDNTINLIFK